MINSPRLSECEEFTRILRLFASNREVTVMQLIHDIVLIGAKYMTVVCPSFGISIFHIHDNAFLAIHGYSLGEHTR